MTNISNNWIPTLFQGFPPSASQELSGLDELVSVPVSAPRPGVAKYPVAAVGSTFPCIKKGLQVVCQNSILFFVERSLLVIYCGHLAFLFNMLQPLPALLSW